MKHHYIANLRYWHDPVQHWIAERIDRDYLKGRPTTIGVDLDSYQPIPLDVAHADGETIYRYAPELKAKRDARRALTTTIERLLER